MREHVSFSTGREPSDELGVSTAGRELGCRTVFRCGRWLGAPVLHPLPAAASARHSTVVPRPHCKNWIHCDHTCSSGSPALRSYANALLTFCNMPCSFIQSGCALRREPSVERLRTSLRLEHGKFVKERSPLTIRHHKCTLTFFSLRTKGQFNCAKAREWAIWRLPTWQSPS